MSCVYFNARTGKCNLHDEDDKKTNYTNARVGYDENGVCVVDDDPDPNDTCDDYNSMDSLTTF